MKKNFKKLSACALVAVLGLSCTVHPVHAEKTEAVMQSDTDEILELDQTAVPMEKSTDIEFESTPEQENEKVQKVTNEPVGMVQAEAIENIGGQEDEPQEQIEVVNALLSARASIIDISNMDANITQSGDYMITGTATSHKIIVSDGVTANIIFQNMNLKSPNGNLKISSNAKVYITLIGENIIQASQDGFGDAVNIADNAELHFTEQSTGSIKLHGASNYWGGGTAVKGGNLYVHGGTVTMIGGNKVKNDYGKSYDVNSIIVTSGIINCYAGGFNSTIPGDCSATYQAFKSPVPEFTAIQTANSIIVNLTNYQEQYGEVYYKLDDGNWGTNNTFSNLRANSSHIVSVQYAGQGSYAQSDEVQHTILTNNATYKITIPATTLIVGKVESTSTISVSKDEPFDLGYQGQVDVTIKNDGNVTDDAKLKLTRQNDAAKYIVTSALLVNGKALGNVNTSVATFKANTDNGVNVCFAQPTETNIPVGDYKGTITFEILYSEK